MRDLRRVVLALVFAVACHLLVATLAFGGPLGRRGACQCQAGGACQCGPACQCGVSDVVFAVAAVTAEDTKSAPPVKAAPAPQTYHYETRCVNGKCTTFMVPDAPSATSAGAAACSEAAACSASGMATVTRRRLFYAMSHPFRGRFRCK